MSAKKGQAEAVRKEEVEKAERYMINTREKKGLEWDGERVPAKHNVTMVQHRVTTIEHYRLL